MIIEKSGGGENQPVGRVVKFSLNETALCSNFLEILRPNKNIVYPAFAAYVCYSIWSNRKVIPSIKQTTGIQNLDISDYLNIKFKIPELNIQKKIANFLDHETNHIDNLISAKEYQISLLTEKRNTILKCTILKGLCSPVKMKEAHLNWLKFVPNHWIVKSLKYVAKLQSGTNLKSEDLKENEEYPVYGGNGFRGFYNEYNYDGHYLMIGRQGALCGNINYANGKFWATEHAVVVTIFDNFNTIYLGELLKIMNLNQYSVSAAQPGLSVEVISNLKIPCPPRKEQDEIVNYFEKEILKIDSLKESTVRSVILLKERRSSLITAAINGKTNI